MRERSLLLDLYFYIIISEFYILLTVNPGMTLGKWPTWSTNTLYNTFIIIILYMFRATLWRWTQSCLKHLEDYNNKQII